VVLVTVAIVAAEGAVLGATELGYPLHDPRLARAT